MMINVGELKVSEFEYKGLRLDEDTLVSIARFCSKFYMPYHTLEDKFQLALTIALEHLEKYNETRGSLKTFVLQVVKTKFINWRRDMKDCRKEQTEESEGEKVQGLIHTFASMGLLELEIMSQEDYELIEAQADIEMILSKVPEETRLLVRRYVESEFNVRKLRNLYYPDMAERTLYRKVSKALEELRLVAIKGGN